MPDLQGREKAGRRTEGFGRAEAPPACLYTYMGLAVKKDENADFAKIEFRCPDVALFWNVVDKCGTMWWGRCEQLRQGERQYLVATLGYELVCGR